jgi:NAD(P)H-hydrate repair Nnr-like enzyme with NAD(P)H-hydrate dehydratase domain
MEQPGTLQVKPASLARTHRPSCIIIIISKKKKRLTCMGRQADEKAVFGCGLGFGGWVLYNKRTLIELQQTIIVRQARST